MGSPWPGMGAVVAAAIAATTPTFGMAALATPVERGLGVSATGLGLALSGFFAISALGRASPDDWWRGFRYRQSWRSSTAWP